MPEKLLNYNEALEVIERFMEDSGIREFCTEICKGKCCNGCYGSRWDCKHNEGRRISCSAFMCIELKNMIGYSAVEHAALRRLKGQIEMAVRAARETCEINEDAHPYFYPLSPEEIKAFELPAKALDNLPYPSKSKDVLDKVTNFVKNVLIPSWKRNNRLI